MCMCVWASRLDQTCVLYEVDTAGVEVIPTETATYNSDSSQNQLNLNIEGVVPGVGKPTDIMCLGSSVG